MNLERSIIGAATFNFAVWVEVAVLSHAPAWVQFPTGISCLTLLGFGAYTFALGVSE